MMGGQRLLLIVDDVWGGELLRELRFNLLPVVTVLAAS